MDQEKRIMQEAERIGGELLSKAQREPVGMSWDTMSMDLNRAITFHKAEGIYSGVSGIVLFFLELYRKTNSQEYLEAAVEGMKWVTDYCKTKPSDYPALITGRMGVPYSLLRMNRFSRETGEKHYVEDALAIAKELVEITDLRYKRVDDLINGTSGSLLAYVHLHAVTGETWILQVIDQYIQHLLEWAHTGPSGLYWDRSESSSSGLCGFSHGAAGIGFTFLEIGRYFRNETFFKIAEQAFRYERHFFREDLKNWPDLRKGIYSDEDREKHRKAFLENDMEFFNSTGDMNAWCHGASGIGLSRLRAFQVLNNELYRQEALTAIEKTISTDLNELPNLNIPRSFTLCHGSGGNADLFLRAYRLFKDPQYLELSIKVALRGLDSYEKNRYYVSGFSTAGPNQQDTSLFMGNAGVGYFYLRVLDPLNVPSVLIPEVEDVCDTHTDLSAYPYIGISMNRAQQIMLKKVFPRSVFISERVIPEQLESFLIRHPFDINVPQTLPDSYIAYLDEIASSIPSKEKEYLEDVFVVELEKWRMDRAQTNHSFLNIKQLISAEFGKELIEKNPETDRFMELKFQLDPGCQLLLTQWNWAEYNTEEWQKNLSGEATPDNWPILLVARSLEIQEIPLSAFAYTILFEFQEPNPVKNAVQATIEAFESVSPEEEIVLKDKIFHQVKEAIMSGVLVEIK